MKLKSLIKYLRSQGQELEEMCNDTDINEKLKESSSDNSEQVSAQKKALIRNTAVHENSLTF